MPRYEPDSLSPDEQVRELATLLAKGLLRWSQVQKPVSSDTSLPVETVENPLELSRQSWLSVHSGDDRFLVETFRCPPCLNNWPLSNG